MNEAELYRFLRQLDRLEALREDLQEIALRGGTAGDEDEDLPPIDEVAVQREMADLGVSTLAEVEAQIATMHAQLDEEEE